MSAPAKIHAHANPELAEAMVVTRFWDQVRVGEPDQCWPWRGDTDDGYGVFFYRGKMRRATELALSFTTGEARLPELDTCHSCDNPPCCNPSHLRFDTRLSNVQDMHERGRAYVPSRKLTNEQVVTIRRRRAAGARQSDLAAQYHVTDGLISQIVRGVRYADVGGPIESKRAQYKRGN